MPLFDLADDELNLAPVDRKEKVRNRGSRCLDSRDRPTRGSRRHRRGVGATWRMKIESWRGSIPDQSFCQKRLAENSTIVLKFTHLVMPIIFLPSPYHSFHQTIIVRLRSHTAVNLRTDELNSSRATWLCSITKNALLACSGAAVKGGWIHCINSSGQSWLR